VARHHVQCGQGVVLAYSLVNPLEAVTLDDNFSASLGASPATAGAAATATATATTATTASVATPTTATATATIPTKATTAAAATTTVPAETTTACAQIEEEMKMPKVPLEKYEQLDCGRTQISKA
jgi:hypothetical protein